MKISASTARLLALHGQGLDGHWQLPGGKEGTAQVIERLGYVQIDTIAVIQRAHHHILWSRHPEYTPRMLHELQAQDRRVFEYWTHAASYIPMRDYCYYRARMRAFAERPRTRQWLQENDQLAKHVMGRIREEGPLGSADFKAPEGFKRGTWWNRKPAKRALETFFSMGELMVAERRNFQRLYDLAERVLPSDLDTSEPDADSIARFAGRRLLSAHGLCSTDIVRGRAARKAFSEAIQDLVGAGEVTPVQVEGLDGTDYYAPTAGLEKAAQLAEATRLHILSPFDNLIIWRRRLEKFFGFDYRLECYLPQTKRHYGYFALPVLWGERFVARIDAKADRKEKTFIVRRITFVPGLQGYDDLLPALAEKLRVFAVFNGCERLIIECTEPETARTLLLRELDRYLKSREACPS